MSQRTFVVLPDLDDQPVLNPVQKAVLAHVQRSEHEQRLILRRWYADQAQSQLRMAQRTDSLRPHQRRPTVPKRHRVVEPALH